jgi:hypothetical protein
MARSGKWLTVCPAQSEHLKRKSTTFKVQQSVLKNEQGSEMNCEGYGYGKEQR